MDYLVIIIAIVTYFAVLALGIASACLMHRRAVTRVRKTDEQWAEAAAGSSAAIERSPA